MESSSKAATSVLERSFGKPDLAIAYNMLMVTHAIHAGLVPRDVKYCSDETRLYGYDPDTKVWIIVGAARVNSPLGLLPPLSLVLYVEERFNNVERVELV